MQVKGLTSANVVTLGTSEYLRVPVSRGAGCGGVGSRIDDGPLGSSLLDRGLDGDLFRGNEGSRIALTSTFAAQGTATCNRSTVDAWLGRLFRPCVDHSRWAKQSPNVALVGKAARPQARYLRPPR
jgi:hypothetical protein